MEQQRNPEHIWMEEQQVKILKSMDGKVCIDSGRKIGKTALYEKLLELQKDGLFKDMKGGKKQWKN